MKSLLKAQVRELRQDVRLHLNNIVGILIHGDRHYRYMRSGEKIDVTQQTLKRHRSAFAALWPDLQRRKAELAVYC
ncbi:hypothetical protein GVN24_02340 [Rhizobium sp. CRIBSB]|nr:hypothetical protein [Rhizobium sp. CRIBSB]